MTVRVPIVEESEVSDYSHCDRHISWFELGEKAEVTFDASDEVIKGVVLVDCAGTLYDNGTLDGHVTGALEKLVLGLDEYLEHREGEDDCQRRKRFAALEVDYVNHDGNVSDRLAVSYERHPLNRSDITAILDDNDALRQHRQELRDELVKLIEDNARTVRAAAGFNINLLNHNTAQLTESRDAVYESRQQERAKNRRLIKHIEDAPHSAVCRVNTPVPGDCDCWKRLALADAHKN